MPTNGSNGSSRRLRNWSSLDKLIYETAVYPYETADCDDSFAAWELLH